MSKLQGGRSRTECACAVTVLRKLSPLIFYRRLYSLYGNSIPSSPVLIAAPATEPHDLPSFLYPTQTYFLPNLTQPENREHADQNTCPVYLQLAGNDTPISGETVVSKVCTRNCYITYPGQCLTANTLPLKHSSWICCTKFNCSEVGSGF